MSLDIQQRACLRFGWTALAVFMVLGLALESLHLMKSPFYFELRIRRELWTLAHAHGALLAMLTLLFAAVADRCFSSARSLAWASRLLRTGAVLVPAGFFLGGWQSYESDPALWIVLVPLGAVAALASVVMAAVGAWRNVDDEQNVE